MIYNNDRTEDLSTSAKLFADNTSLFWVVHDTQTSANDLNKDLEINNWVFQLEINFDSDPTKQEQEVVFICEAKKIKKQPPELFCKKCVLKNFINFTAKHLS